MKYYLVLLSALLILTSFTYQYKWSSKNPIPFKAPAGTIKIGDNFFADETEASNQYWLDYLHHLRMYYGDTSSKYLSALPNPTIWKNYSVCVNPSDYLRHPYTRDFPLVGITQEQARNYCKWRSDRVFEYMLIRSGIKTNDQEVLFTIEKYFKGEIKTISNKKIEYYPAYELPTVEQWQQIKRYNDLFQSQLKPRKKQNKCKCEPLQPPEKCEFLTDVIPCPDSVIIRIANIYRSDYNPPKNYLYNLDENVREWLKEENMAAGSNWIDSNISAPLKIESPDAVTGFRCVAKWKKWEE